MNVVRGSCLAVVVALSGCLVLPVPSKVPYAGEPAVLETGATTRADVLLLLGAPAISHDSGGVYVYDADRPLAVWVAAFGGGYTGAVGGGLIERRYVLALEFGADGVLNQWEVGEVGVRHGLSTDKYRRWAEYCTGWGLCLLNGGEHLVRKSP